MRLRKRGTSQKRADMSYTLFILCIVAASAGNVLPMVFFQPPFCVVYLVFLGLSKSTICTVDMGVIDANPVAPELCVAS